MFSDTENTSNCANTEVFFRGVLEVFQNTSRTPPSISALSRHSNHLNSRIETGGFRGGSEVMILR